MAGSDIALPSGFEALEPFVAHWAQPTAALRAAARDEASAEERSQFFEVAKGVIPGALEYLDKKPLGSFDDAEMRLMRLALGFAHATLAVETMRDMEEQHAEDRRHLVITRAPADA